MINVASIRAAALATPGDVIGIRKAQLDQLLAEVECGQMARREISVLRSAAASAGIDRVSGAS